MLHWEHIGTGYQLDETWVYPGDHQQITCVFFLLYSCLYIRFSYLELDFSYISTGSGDVELATGHYPIYTDMTVWTMHGVQFCYKHQKRNPGPFGSCPHTKYQVDHSSPGSMAATRMITASSRHIRPWHDIGRLMIYYQGYQSSNWSRMGRHINIWDRH